MAIAGICLGGAGLFWTLIWLPLMISILLPSLSRARELAKRAVDASNLRGVGQACYVYADDNRDRLPPNLQYLLDGGQITPGQLQDPADPDATNTCDYWFVSYGAVSPPLEDLPSDWVVAYSDPAYHDGEGAHILFIDGHVEFIREPEFSKRIEQFKREFEEKCGAPPVIIEPY
jgi:prepilin-type processing-associated H-X9-DG protein